MTGRRPGPRPSRGTGRDPYGIGSLAPFLAPLLSTAGLLVIAALTVFALTGRVPFLGSPSNNGGSGDGNIPPGRTPSPSAPPDVNPGIQIQGSLVYVKAGNLWIQSGNTPRELTTTGRDSQPTWSPDGTWIYFVETRETNGRFPAEGVVKNYDLKYPILTRIHPDGTGERRSSPGSTRPGPPTPTPGSGSSSIPPSPPTARASRWSPTARTRRRATWYSSSSTCGRSG